MSALAETDDGRVNRISDEERLRINDFFEEKKSDKALAVDDIYTFRFYNEWFHHTYKFERDDVTIIRRGQKFVLFVSFGRKIDVANDMARLQLAYGDKPRENKGTLVRIPLNWNSDEATTDYTRSWTVDRTKIWRDNQAMKIYITSPPDAFIGYYDVYIETKHKHGTGVSRHKCKSNIIMLFNPWCKDDSVYMEDENERKEYILNEQGLIWKGSRTAYWPDPWAFGQFQQPVLTAALLLLKEAGLTDDAMNNPVIISRKITAMVNMNDRDKGILWGRWTKEYPEDSTPPWEWLGSVPIIKQYMDSQQKSVKYGQCWVFSGVTTTLLRALGIPTRTVTNFASAHDHDVSMTIDKFMDEDGKIKEYMGDSIWNFHVWNECWFKRHDLPPEYYDGWQIVDATPQESSEGIMQCGPAPVRAVKEGHVYLNYDIPFVFAEVNADVLYWMIYDDDRSDEIVDVNSLTVGGAISTKAVLSDDRNDLTDNYRYPAGSPEDDKVRAFVSRFSTRRVKHIYEDVIREQEIEVDILYPKNSLFGEDLVIQTKIKNTTNEARSVSVQATLLHCTYTGVAEARIKHEKFSIPIKANEEAFNTIKLPFDEYKSIPNPDARFQLYFTARNETTGRFNIKTEIFELGKPAIEFEVPDKIEFKKKTIAVVKFKNTTAATLTNCKFRIESTGLLDEVILRRQYPLKVNEEWSTKIELEPSKESAETGLLLAGFESTELRGIKGTSIEFTVINLPVPPNDEGDL